MVDAVKQILADKKKLERVARVAFDSVDTDKSGNILINNIIGEIDVFIYLIY